MVGAIKTYRIQLWWIVGTFCIFTMVANEAPQTINTRIFIFMSNLIVIVSFFTALLLGWMEHKNLKDKEDIVIKDRKSKDLIAEIDYQIRNNGIEGMLGNSYNIDIPSYLLCLAREHSDICDSAFRIITMAFVIERQRQAYQEYSQFEKELIRCKLDMKQLQNDYMTLSDELLKYFDIARVVDSIKPSYDYE